MMLLIALLLDRVMLKLTIPSYASHYTAGYGSLDDVIHRRAKAPVAYRVLVPWLIGAAERLFPALHKHRLPALYEPLRIVGIAFALWAASLALGTTSALLVAAMLPATFLYDFWDWPWELASFALALTGNMQLAIIGIGLHAFARPETAGLSMFTYGLVTQDWIGVVLMGVAALTAMLVVRRIVGRKPMVAPALSVIRLNLDDLRGLFKNRPFYLSPVFMSLLVMGLTAGMVLSGVAGAAWPIPLVLCVAQCVWQARISETRSLTPALLWIAMGLTYGYQ